MSTITAPNPKAVAERERKARIRKVAERLMALDGDTRDHVKAQAEQAEAKAKAEGSRRATVAFLEDALDAQDKTDAHIDDLAVEVTADQQEAQGDAIRQARRTGVTLAELKVTYGLTSTELAAILGDTVPVPAKTAAAATRTPRAARDVRGEGGDRQEKCPACGEWHDARVTDTGDYEKAADFRKGRADCRTCYNRRWREGQLARKAK
jgi:imidazolonepropionase-like amidohydrolase